MENGGTSTIQEADEDQPMLMDRPEQQELQLSADGLINVPIEAPYGSRILCGISENISKVLGINGLNLATKKGRKWKRLRGKENEDMERTRVLKPKTQAVG